MTGTGVNHTRPTAGTIDENQTGNGHDICAGRLAGMNWERAPNDVLARHA
jgi:hypothetical protein